MSFVSNQKKRKKRNGKGEVSYHAANVAQVTEVPAHDGLVVIWGEELQVTQLLSTSSRVVLHVQADPGGDA